MNRFRPWPHQLTSQFQNMSKLWGKKKNQRTNFFFFPWSSGNSHDQVEHVEVECSKCVFGNRVEEMNSKPTLWIITCFLLSSLWTWTIHLTLWSVLKMSENLKWPLYTSDGGDSWRLKKKSLHHIINSTLCWILGCSWLHVSYFFSTETKILHVLIPRVESASFLHLNAATQSMR